MALSSCPRRHASDACTRSRIHITLYAHALPVYTRRRRRRRGRHAYVFGGNLLRDGYDDSFVYTRRSAYVLYIYIHASAAPSPFPRPLSDARPRENVLFMYFDGYASYASTRCTSMVRRYIPGGGDDFIGSFRLVNFGFLILF